MHDPTRLVRRHAALRYLGMPLFLGGGLGLIAAFAGWIAGELPGSAPLLYLGATGLGLGTFGLHNDTALAAMLAVGEPALEPPRAAELRAELARDRSATLELTATPRAAAAVTLLSLGFHALAAVKLLG